MQQINNVMGTDQANQIPTPAIFMADCDASNPTEVPVWIDPNRAPVRIILNVFSRQFQANSTGAASAGSSTPTTGGGSSHQHSYSTPNHVHMTNASWSASADTNSHHHDYLLRDYLTQDVVTSDAGGTSASDTSHTHQVTIAAHSHTMVFGIFKFPYFAPVQMHVNAPGQSPYGPFGTQGGESSAFSCTGLDITSLYSPSGGAGLLKPGMNFIYFTTVATTSNPSGLLRIYAEVHMIYKS